MQTQARTARRAIKWNMAARLSVTETWQKELSHEEQG